MLAKKWHLYVFRTQTGGPIRGAPTRKGTEAILWGGRSKRKLEISREHFTQRWAQKRTEKVEKW